MGKFEELQEIADRLLGPNGCPWDREQTLFTLQPYLVEETHELIEAIDGGDGTKIAEELGDVLYALVFVAKLGEARGLFTMEQALVDIVEKLIRRHPHVFGEQKVGSVDDVLKNWDAIKKKEQASQDRKSVLDGIPPSLPALARAQKVISKLKRAKSPTVPKVSSRDRSEEAIGADLWNLAAEAQESGMDLESALRRYCQKQEEQYRWYEKSPESGSQQKPTP